MFYNPYLQKLKKNHPKLEDKKFITIYKQYL